MTKYVRTKEGIYELKENGIGQTPEEVQIALITNDYKVADTIEELCDEFVVIRKTDNLHNLLRNYALEDLHFLKDRQKHNCEVYGAIWTDKGLIYVAKMNEDGELVLI